MANKDTIVADLVFNTLTQKQFDNADTAGSLNAYELYATPDNSLKGNLFDFKWADHLLNDISWLRGDTFSWQSGDVYVSAYNHLVADFENAKVNHWYAWVEIGGGIWYTKTPTVAVGDTVYNDDFSVFGQVDTVYSETNFTIGANDFNRSASDDITVGDTETIDGIEITYYRAEDGHKICLPDQEDKILALYNATGVAWYYILDEDNAQFKLPRTKHGFTGLRDSVGGYVPESLPNITGTIKNDSNTTALNPTGAFRISSSTTQGGIGSSYQFYGNIMEINASLSSPTYQDNAPVQERATQMYLYFYVGNFERDAVEQTAGLNAELFNQKMDNGTPLIRDIFSPDEWENESMEQILSAGIGSGDLVFTKNWQEYDYLWFSSVADSSNALDDSPHWLNVKWMLSQAKAGVTNLAVVRYSSGAYWYVNPQAWTETTMPEGSGNESLWINKVYGIKLKNITAKNVGLLNYKGLFETASALVATVPTAMGEWAIVSNDETQGGLQTKYFSTQDASGNFVWAFGGIIDSSLVGADYVVDSQIPTAENGYTWYRKYKSGWVEQGGLISTNVDAAFIQTLPVVMASDNYNVVVTRKTISDDTGTINSRWCRVYNLTTTTFTTWGKYGNHTDIFWQVCGVSA